MRTSATALPLGVNRRSTSLVVLPAVVIWVAFTAAPLSIGRLALLLARSAGQPRSGGVQQGSVGLSPERSGRQAERILRVEQLVEQAAGGPDRTHTGKRRRADDTSSTIYTHLHGQPPVCWAH